VRCGTAVHVFHVSSQINPNLKEGS
jgi:hypothetical protein